MESLEFVDAGEAFMIKWMGDGNYQRWANLKREIQHPSTAAFVSWLLDLGCVAVKERRFDAYGSNSNNTANSTLMNNLANALSAEYSNAVSRQQQQQRRLQQQQKQLAAAAATTSPPMSQPSPNKMARTSNCPTISDLLQAHNLHTAAAQTTASPVAVGSGRQQSNHHVSQQQSGPRATPSPSAALLPGFERFNDKQNTSHTTRGRVVDRCEENNEQPAPVSPVNMALSSKQDGYTDGAAADDNQNTEVEASPVNMVTKQEIVDQEEVEEEEVDEEGGGDAVANKSDGAIHSSGQSTHSSVPGDDDRGSGSPSLHSQQGPPFRCVACHEVVQAEEEGVDLGGQIYHYQCARNLTGDDIGLEEQRQMMIRGHDRKTRRQRTVFTHQQLTLLQSCFEMDDQPGSQVYEKLAESTGLDKAVVKVWFQNARAKKRKRMFAPQSGQDSSPYAATDSFSVRTDSASPPPGPFAMQQQQQTSVHDALPPTGHT